MRNHINLFENQDAFSTKGHADIKVRPNDPRFADNPLSVEPLDEFDGSSPSGRSLLDRLHKAFQDGGIGDQEIKQGIRLTDEGLHRVAAAFGTSPEEVNLLIASLTQHLRDESADDVEESYNRFVKEEGEDGADERPFANAADRDHLSAEDDYLGDVTVSSARSGNSKFYQGSEAATINNRLKAAGQDKRKKQEILRPLVEEDAESDYAEEIKSDAGSYNFPWRYESQTGLGTMQYGVRSGKPWLRLISIRDDTGDDIEADTKMRNALLIQARKFIPDA